MEHFVKSIVSLLTPFSWRKFVAIVVALVATAVVLYLSSCSVSRKVNTYGITEKTYVSYDTITFKQSKKIPKDFVYEP